MRLSCGCSTRLRGKRWCSQLRYPPIWNRRSRGYGRILRQLAGAECMPDGASSRGGIEAADFGEADDISDRVDVGRPGLLSRVAPETAPIVSVQTGAFQLQRVGLADVS